ncbi:MAG: lysophospholipid acyltransferase family protein [Candidatus Eisenbacteria bacterium]|uniref:Lysophospholipid acyltransferase family protein n=1 Tax=Eiseniibacteriota bacterium TaxID=2212470 RepID=A0A956LZG8_UNCEI|nr:lysophospholipid acyltransferase family protein [Candidatus Eisenbacteria bacterium]
MSAAQAVAPGGSAPRRTRGGGRWRHLAEYLGLRLALVLLAVLGERGATALGTLLGRIAFDLLRIRRRVTLENLRHAFPEWSEPERLSVARLAYRHFGIVFLELARLSRYSPSEIRARIRIPDEAGLAAALAHGRGAVLLTGHFGNWEMLGGALAALGHPIWVTVATQRNPWVDRYVTQTREATGMHVLKVEDGGLAIARQLRKNHLVAFVADQDAGRRGVFVPLFGRPASTALGPVRFARMQRCPIISGFAVRQADGSYQIELPPVRHVREDLPPEEADRIALEELARDLESAVRRHPEQWFWMHRRWKTRPLAGGTAGEG